jgi:FkbM family methyltransferase
MIKHVLFDVGANWGTDSLPQTESNFHYLTWAFEPTPELYDHLVAKSQPFRNRYTVEKIALSDVNGVATFNVAAHQDWGTSSLLTFSNRLDKTWPGRADFYVDHQIEVEVRRFDTWFEDARPEIEWIDFFHCDTQGTDLKVLKGMGDYFQMIRQGVVEVPLNKEVMLYQGQHTREEVLDFLSDQHYEVYQTTHQQNEDNLYFQRKAK